ncbi:hypothetical protein MVEN_02552900 [Mycena venus]|uniref:Uncharacterized protein n=1 Tax=Mycena venus TaxID=2733690 RepID=A0A8H6U1X1_9AGAR|nr:hypothetical protein MVEN_02552900 [Mycena venus]
MEPDLHPIAEPGYQSDTGERDVPTLADFENNTPVTVALGPVKRGSGKVLNRKGRAIIRIMAKHGWSHKAIAYIFRISDTSVSRAVENIRYNPRDNIDEDPVRAGPKFCGVLPPPLSDALLKILKARDDAPKPNPSLTLDVLNDEWDTDELKYPDEEFSSNDPPQREAKVKCSTRIKEVAEDDDNQASAYGRFRYCCPDGSVFQADATAIPQKRIYEHTISPFTPSPSSSVQASSRHFLPSMLIVCQPVLTGSPAKKPRYSDVLPAGRSQSQESSTDLRLLARGSPSSHASNTPRLSPSQAPFQAQVQSLFIVAADSRTNVHLSKGSSPSLRSMLPPPSHNRPLPSPLTDRALQPDLPAFLKTLTDVDFTPHHELFKAQGFTVSRLRSLAKWSKNETHEALSRLLMGSGPAAVGRPGMKAIEFVTFEIAIRPLAKASAVAPAPLARTLLPPPGSNATNSGTTLPLFLKNVMGFDLSEHHAFVVSQGVDIGYLSRMSGWERSRLQEVLKLTLLEPTNEADRVMSSVPGDGKGMKALEVMALEYCIRRAGAEI